MSTWLIACLSLGVGSGPDDVAAAGVDASTTTATTPRPGASDRTWVQHVLQRSESLDDVAERYGVEVDELRRLNDLTPRSKLVPGMLLRIHARRLPRPRQRVRVSVREKDTWEDVAKRYGVTVDELKRANARFAKRRRPKGLRLHVWMDSRVLPPGSGAHGPTPPQLDVPTGGLSVGRPHRGRLESGVALPESDLYTVRISRIAYGTTLAVTAIVQAIASFRYQTGFEGDVIIGAMSRRTGRRLRPHRSHQSGRDVDVRLPALAFVEGEHDLSAQEVDWPAAWGLIRAFVDTGAVLVVFLERRHFRRLRRAGREMGASPDEIAHVMSRVRHSKGHTSHFHVRFICSPVAERCRD